MNSIYLSSVSTITNHENKLFAATWYIIGSDSRLVVDVYSSTDNGNNWVKADFGWPNSHISSFAAIGSDLYAATHSHGVFRSTNDGVTWNDVGTGLVNKSISTLVAMGTNLVAGAFDGIYLSIDSGANWSSVNNGLPPYLRSVNCILSKGENLFTGVYFSGVYILTSNGSSWMTVNSGLPEGRHVSYLSANDSTLFAACMGTGLYSSTNTGVTWSYVGLNNTTIKSLAVSGQNIFVGTTGSTGSRFFFSTNNGIDWSTDDSGFPEFPFTIHSLALTRNYIFAGTNKGIWRRPLTELITSVNHDPDLTPGEYSLGQNYPNPFNPSTIIPFTLPSESFVLLKVFDILGKEVATIVSKKMPPGSYHEQWHSDNLPSGIYIYRLQTAAYTHSRKLILLK